MSEKTKKSLKPVGSRPGVMYASCKVHKAIVNNCSPFQTSLSASSNKFVKYLVQILKPLTTNKITVKITFILLRESLINNLLSLQVIWMLIPFTNSLEYLKRFLNYLHFPLVNIYFTIKNEKDNGVSFIDVKVTYKQDKFTTSFYHKPTVRRRHTNFTVFYHPHAKYA